MSEPLPPPRFRERPADQYLLPDLNPYLKIHQEFGPPVLTATEAQAWRGRWSECFGREAPLHVEIGSGNGFFLSGMAAAHPEWSWLGLEIRFKRVILTARKLVKAGVDGHARVARYDAWCLRDLFLPGSVSGFYINHPDPWPRERQAKNRLMQAAFVDTLAELLVPGGELRLKTDAPWNAEALIELLPGRPFALLGRSDHIARDGAPWPDDVITNYQSKFNKIGKPVLAVRLRRTQDAPDGPEDAPGHARGSRRGPRRP